MAVSLSGKRIDVKDKTHLDDVFSVSGLIDNIGAKKAIEDCLSDGVRISIFFHDDFDLDKKGWWWDESPSSVDKESFPLTELKDLMPSFDVEHKELVSAASILEAGLGHMKDRATTYDKPEGERSMDATVKAFNAITGDGLMNTEERGWLFMVLLKAVRSQQGEKKLDNYEDGAAYFGLCGEAAMKEQK